MRPLRVLPLSAVLLSATACNGLKEALTAHVDVVARAGSQELTVNRLGDLLGNAKIQVPVTRETAAILADIWTGYQQLAFAAAHGDSLNDKKIIDPASESEYNQAAGGLLSARHILIGFKNPGVPASEAEKDSAKKKADMVHA